MNEFPVSLSVRASAHGEAVASHWFATMLNPKYRGSAWSWPNFPIFAENHARATVWQNFSELEWREWEPELREAAGRSAAAAAQRLVHESGILDWWSSPILN